MALLQCNNYICHLFAVRRDLLKKVGLLNPAYDGAQDYDFVLRCAEQAKDRPYSEGALPLADTSGIDGRQPREQGVCV